jgi:hypothetical protein
VWGVNVVVGSMVVEEKSCIEDLMQEASRDAECSIHVASPLVCVCEREVGGSGGVGARGRDAGTEKKRRMGRMKTWQLVTAAAPGGELEKCLQRS